MTEEEGVLHLLWTANIDVNLNSLSKYHIHVFMMVMKTHRGSSQASMAHLDTVKRSETWELLNSLQPPVNTPRLVGGDFNLIIKHEEKHRGNVRLERQLQLFRKTDYCQL